MSNEVYPSLAGLIFPVVRTPIWKTQRRDTASGRSFRASQMTFPRYRLKLRYELLRDTVASPEFRTLLGFFNKHFGGLDSFLFNDPDDSAVTAQQFGVGDGVTTAFQLVRTLGGFAEPVFDLNGAPQIYKAGVLQTVSTHYTVNSTAGITFLTPPGSGQALTWTGAYYWRCAFDGDEIDFQKFLARFWETQTVSLITDRP